MFNDTLSLELGYDAIYRDYDHVRSLGDTEDYTGFEHQGIATVTWLPRPGTTLIGSLGGRAAGTKEDFLDYKGLQASVGAYQTYTSPLTFLPYDWLAGLAVGYEARWYDSPDPSVDTGTQPAGRHLPVRCGEHHSPHPILEFYPARSNI